MKKAPLLAAVLVAVSFQASAAHFVYVSSPGDGLITQYRFDDQTGALSVVNKTSVGAQVGPSAITPDGKALFAAVRAKPFKVVGYQIDPQSGELKAQSEAPLADSMAYLATDRSGRWLMAASYGGDLISLQAIAADHLLGDKAPQIYKTGLHAHSVRSDPSNRFVYAGNLGVDQVLQYRLDAQAGTLTPIGQGSIATPSNFGPRHLAFSPNGKYLYVVGEMAGAVLSYAIDAKTGALTQVSSAQGIPERLGLSAGIIRDSRNNDGKDDPTPRIWAADIRIAPSGTLLFISERTSSSVSAFKLDPEDGKVTYLENYSVQEKQPRNIAFSPDGHWLLVSGEKSDVIGSYAVSPEGGLKRVGEAPAGVGALWIEVK
ncbi:lactonase family protein [Pseudomonas sp. nanlin1]|uniref:lactonase family protein n=1 Tax=Pseudomonas sp. nanlin1 TaxID=3040605 RepID=UPI00388CF4B1